MNIIKPFLLAVKELFVKYPAILSGCLLYGYLFISIIRLFVKAKRGILLIEDIYDIFDRASDIVARCAFVRQIS